MNLHAMRVAASNLDIGAPALGVSVAIGLAFYLFMAVTMWRVFTKAGKSGWLALIPIVNTFVLVKIAGKSYWWIALLIIPLVNIVALVMIYHALSVAFGHGAGFTVGLILLPIVFLPILAFGSSDYRGPGQTGGSQGGNFNYGGVPQTA